MKKIVSSDLDTRFLSDYRRHLIHALMPYVHSGTISISTASIILASAWSDIDGFYLSIYHAILQDSSYLNLPIGNK